MPLKNSGTEKSNRKMDGLICQATAEATVGTKSNLIPGAGEDTYPNHKVVRTF